MLACLGLRYPFADASDASLRAGVEDNLAHRLRPTAIEGGRPHDAIHRGFQSDRVGRDLDPDYPVGIRLPALPEEAGGTVGTRHREYWGISERRADCSRAVRSRSELSNGCSCSFQHVDELLQHLLRQLA